MTDRLVTLMRTRAQTQFGDAERWTEYMKPLAFGRAAKPEEIGWMAAFLASDGSPSRAADALYCHRNTVMHRLRRIESMTGRKLTDPRSRLLWQLALLRTSDLGAGDRRSA